MSLKDFLARSRAVMAGATKGKWRRYRPKWGSYDTIRLVDSIKGICALHGENSTNNAEAIVHAVNTHAQLLDAVEILSEKLLFIQSQAGMPDASEACRQIIKTSREALAKAEELLKGEANGN